MFRMLSNQHYPHRANQRLRSWANAVFQNHGVCGQAVPSFPSPSPVIHFFFLLLPQPQFLDEPREETLATQATVQGDFLTAGNKLGVLYFFLHVLGQGELLSCENNGGPFGKF